jgi:hypothetical protein
VVGRELMQEEHGRAAAGLLEIEPDMVARDGVGHFGFPVLIAGNSRSQFMFAAAMRRM